MDDQEDLQAIQESSKEGGQQDLEGQKNYAKNKLAFRNVSAAMIEALEHPPNLHEDLKKEDSEEEEEAKFMLEDIVGAKETSRTKAFGYLMAWNSLLNKIEQGRVKTTLENDSDYSQVLSAVSEYLEEN
jgi:hypothetical protein